MKNALTIDVEDYFHVAAFEKYIDPDDWDNYPLRVVDNTLRILDLLDEHSIKATFFVLGWVAERSPSLIKEIDRRGHEIACHGYGHQLIYRIGPERFREDIRRSKMLLEDICSRKVEGYRAPSFSITNDSIWAFDILIEEGFTYDSSVFPVMHDIYGIEGAKCFQHEVITDSGTIREFPLSTIKIAGYRFPVAGGGYLRLYPLWLTQKAISHINTNEKQSAVVYFHPWEIDPDQPRIKAGLKSSFRHYVNLDKTMGKINYLLKKLKFAPMMEVLKDQQSDKLASWPAR